MKRVITTLFVAIIAVVTMSAQNFTAPSKTKEVFKDSVTTYTYTIKDNMYKVYKTRKGAFYIWKTSKNTGKNYRMYLPKEIQVAMGRKYETDSNK